jgi:hypothetical protein
MQSPCRFLVAAPLSGDLLLCAKDLFVGAKKAPATRGYVPSRGKLSRAELSDLFGSVRSALRVEPNSSLKLLRSSLV